LATYWEVVIKGTKGKLDVAGAHVWWKRALLDLIAVPLPILANHIDHLKGLLAIHQDSFDRIVLASATAESLIVITVDAEMQLYASERLHILG
jgi:PIN domain nuclease of toxin-antitoxin system